MKLELEKGVDKTVVFLGDIHCPFQDDAAIICAVRVVKEAKPDVIVFLGDIVDFAQVSRYEGDPRQDTIQEELDQAQAILFQFREAAGEKCRIFFCEGNHDARLQRYLARLAPGALGLECLKLPKLLGLDEMNITFIPENERFIIDDLIVTHGWFASPSAGTSAHKAINVSAGYNYIQGHCHRLAKVWLTTYDMHSKFGVEAGCLLRLEPECFPYLQDRNINWKQGMCVWNIRHNGDDRHADMDLISIKDGHCIYNGKVI